MRETADHYIGFLRNTADNWAEFISYTQELDLWNWKSVDEDLGKGVVAVHLYRPKD